MKPRKRILVFAAKGAAATKFVLDTRGMHTRVATEVGAFSDDLFGFQPDAALIYHDGGAENPDHACERVAHYQGVPTLVVVRTAVWPDAICADMTLGAPQSDMEHIYAGLRLIVTRKRGSKSADGRNTQMDRARGQRAVAAANARVG